jgi:membrane protease YdiL (CAAX protease family)
MEKHIGTTRNDGNALPNWGVLGTIIWGSIIFSVFIIIQVITIIASALKSEHVLTDEQLRELFTSSVSDGGVLSVSTLFTTVICCVLIAVAIKLKRGSRLTDYLAIKAVPLKTLLFWLVSMSAFIAASDALTVLLGRPVVPPVSAAMYATAHPVWILWVAFVIAAPLFEETFFRGFLFKGLASSSIGPIGAITLTAIFWAMIHTQYDAYLVGTIFCMGLLFGAARLQTGSILIPLVLHAFSNIVSTIETALLS